MKIEYDPNKNRRNIDNRNLSFELAKNLVWDTAQIDEDTRNNYSESRFVATGYLFGRLHIICFTPVDGGIRVISFRKANSREIKRYEQATIDR
ncbi:MAG: BrnT family toxin [Desulfamplus sp.]|nr:BrnT family toxin [Desulfamplus sp.]